MKATAKKIQGMYQRAMNLRDSSPTPRHLSADQVEVIEDDYSRAYRRAFKTGNVGEFVNATRKYRKIIRSAKA